MRIDHPQRQTYRHRRINRIPTLPQRGDFMVEGQEIVVVGLFANVEQSRHFVPEGRNIHAHAVFPSLGVAGHLKTLELEAGAHLQLQAR